MNKIKFAGLMALLFLCHNSIAQPFNPDLIPCLCATTTLPLNTGYDFVTYPSGTNPNGLLTPPANDPKWFIKSFNSLYQTCFEPPATPSFLSVPRSAVIVDLSAHPLLYPPHGWAANGSNYQWISYSDNESDWLPLETGINDDCYYSVTYAKEFVLCADAPSDVIHYDLYINRDNWVNSVKICNQTVFAGETKTGTYTYHDGSSTLNISGDLHIPLSKLTLYQIEVEIGNEPGSFPINATGMQLIGNLSSNNGYNYFLPDAYPDGCP